MQDGARCHTAGTTLDDIKRKNVHYISNWPPSSPDLNPIENFWALLQQRVALHPDGPARTSSMSCDSGYWTCGKRLTRSEGH